MPGPRRPPYLWYLKGFRIFRHLPRAQLARLRARITPRHVEAGQAVYRVGRMPPGVFLVRKGAVEVARLGPGGRKITLAVVGPGEAFGFLGLLEGGGWPHVATALGACELWRVPAREFRRLCRFHPGFTLELARTLSGKAILFSAKIESLLFKTVQARLAECLEALADRFGVHDEHGWRIGVPLTQQNLADLIGASRQHVSTAIVRLEARGLIQRPRGRRGRYGILDRAGLMAATQGP